MKRKYSYKVKDRIIEREYTYIPVRYILAIALTVIEILSVIAVVALLCYFVPYFYIAAALTSAGCLLAIVASDDNPDYKIPWILVVILIPVAGFMIYLMFYSRKLKPKYMRRIKELENFKYTREDTGELERIRSVDPHAASLARMLCETADTNIFTDTDVRYFPLGEDMHISLLEDLHSAEKFIYMEYFIIEEGEFWNSILDVLKQKAEMGVEVKLLYDDIGCMCTLSGDYYKKLSSYNIDALPFSRLRGNADSEFNNRSHRKITVIDGRVGYTGGVNIADEYINKKQKHGHWKDTAIRLEGEAVFELTRLFLVDFGINSRCVPTFSQSLYPVSDIQSEGFVIPFGDGPRPIYKRRVGKGVIRNMLEASVERVYITTPYLIIDNELLSVIENTALRGVDVRIILPHIPDKRLVFMMTRSFYPRLLSAGVKIYEYTPGFIHAKGCIADGKSAMIGTVNLDYRSLVHHFENGVWLYGAPCIENMEEDFCKTLRLSEQIRLDMLKTGPATRLFRSLVKIFAPLL